MDGGRQNLVLHEYAPSGNCYKIRLTAGLLGISLERRHYDIMKGGTRTPEFLANVSANGRIPVLQIGPGLQVGTRFLSESNAICHWLADGSALIPADRFERADMLRWMFWEQYQHEPNIATLRFWRAFVGEASLTPAQREQIDAKTAAGADALAMMERHLCARDWFVGMAPSLADICLFAYTHVADEGGFDLTDFPRTVDWLARVKSLPDYIPITA